MTYAYAREKRAAFALGSKGVRRASLVLAIQIRTHMRYRSLLVTSACLAALCCTQGCSEPNALGACTLIGCSSGVIVRLATLPTTTFRVELTPNGGNYGTTYAFDCTRAGGCPQDIMFPDIITESARVTVTTPIGSRTTELPSVTYESVRPNGARCGPECRQAKITAQIPE